MGSTGAPTVSPSSSKCTVRDQAHRLKSSAQTVGALRLANLCETIEQTARHAEVDVLAEHVECVRREVDIVYTHLAR